MLSTKHKIPKKIHFIWAGGEDIMPPDALSNVASWAQANPDFRVKIWVDALTDSKVREKYRDAFANLFPDQEFPNIEIIDINEAGICTPEIRYEISHLVPNYGSSSDQLRYEILYAEGGMHVDCKDVFPKKDRPLGSVEFPYYDRFAGLKVFDSELPDHRLLLHVTPHSFLGHGKESAGTEAMACTPGHPKMKELSENARAAYKGPKWAYKLQKFIYQHFQKGTSKETHKKDVRGTIAFGRHSRVLWAKQKTKESQQEVIETTLDQEELKKRRGQETLDLTGPGMAAKVLQIRDVSQPSEYLMPHDEARSADWVDLPPDHAGSWGPIKFVPHDRATAIEKTINSIRFEVDEMKIFNLQAHVEHVAGSMVAAGLIDNPMSLEEHKQSIKEELTQILAQDQQRFKIVNDRLILNSNLFAKKM